MSIIQQIQEKYAKAMAVVIALALVIFVVMLAFENGGNMFQSNSTTVGKINGQKIDVQSFSVMVDRQENALSQQYQRTGAVVRQQAVDAVWNGEVERIVLSSELEKLGMQIGKREMGDLLYGANPPQQLLQNFTDPATGVYNGQLAKQQINEMLRNKQTSEKDRADLNAFLDYVETQRMVEKYSSLLSNSTNFPKWMIEQQNADASQIANISLVREFYTSIPDTAVTVTDKEIESYVSKHKKQFEQEESRSIAYVAFSALPTAADSAATLEQINSLRAEFDSTTDAFSMVQRNGTDMPYSEMYLPKSQLQNANQQMMASHKDTILTMSRNAVYGPYLDGGNYVMAKLLDVKVLPDSVKCRHILLGTMDPQSGQPLMADSVAKFKADSIAAAIRGGASFDQLNELYSTDQVAKQDKGEMTFSSIDIQGPGFAKEFGDFILFGGRPGDKKVVKTSFGWHYIEIMKYINEEPHYKIAYIAKKINPSNETDNAANNLATKFASDSRDAKSFDANAEKLRAQGFNKLFAQDIGPNAAEVLGLGESRSFVKAIYDADKGDVLQPERVGDSYVVAIVTEVNKKGTQSAAKARMMVEPLLRNEKKAEIIKNKIGAITTLEAAAAALGNKPIDHVDSVRLSGGYGSMIAGESKVIGAAFNPANNGKVVPEAIADNQGVYVIRVNSVAATPLADANVAEQRKQRAQQARMAAAYRPVQQALIDAAEIKDSRSKFF